MGGAKNISYKQLVIDLLVVKLQLHVLLTKLFKCLFKSFALLYAENPLLNTDYYKRLLVTGTTVIFSANNNNNNSIYFEKSPDTAHANN